METTITTTTDQPTSAPLKRPIVYDLAESERLIALARQAPDDARPLARLLADQLEAAGRLLVQGDIAANILEVDCMLDAGKAPGCHEAAEIASLRIRLAAAHERINELCDRTGPEYLAGPDLELAAWLGTVAGTHPQLNDPTAPLAWPAAARVQLEGLISRYRGGDLPGGLPPRAEQLRIAAEIHTLCEAHDCGPESSAEELADAIILDDDREWRRLHGDHGAPGVQ